MSDSTGATATLERIDIPPSQLQLPIRKPRSASPVRRAWNSIVKQLTSIRLAIALLIGLGLFAGIGTIIPQIDVYHSIPFTALLSLLGLNIAVCSAHRLTTLVRASRLQLDPLDDHVHEHGPLREKLDLPGPLSDAVAGTRRVLESHRLAIRTKEHSGTTYMIGEAGGFAAWGPVITHLSFLLILSGAVVGSLFGFNGNVNIVEGTGVTLMHLPDGKVKPLGFELRCNDFEATFYPGSRQPSDFRSDLSVFEGGKEIIRKTIRVNDPLSHNGMTFFQSNYGPVPLEAGGAKVALLVTAPDGTSRALEAPVGEAVRFDDETSLLVRQVVGDFRMGPDGIQDGGSLDNPAARVAVIRSGQLLQEGWRFLRHPEFGAAGSSAWKVDLKDLAPGEYTGLRVSHDPGVGLVYAGGTLLCLGLMISFMQRQRRIWARIAPHNNRVRVSLAGRTVRHTAALEPEFSEIVESLRPVPASAAPLASAKPLKRRSRS